MRDASRAVLPTRICSKAQSSAATVLHPQAIAISPGGNNAYVTSENKGKLSQYTINPTTGTIAPLSPAAVSTTRGAFGVAVTPYATISVSMAAPNRVAKGSNFEYKIEVRNRGPSSAWQIALTDHLSSGAEFREVNAPSGHCSTPRPGAAPARSAALKMLKNGAAWRIQITVTKTSNGPVPNGKPNLTSVTPHPS